MTLVRVFSKSKPLPSPDEDHPAAAPGSGSIYGNWDDYTRSPGESLKNINDILTARNKGYIYQFVNGLFDDIPDYAERSPVRWPQEFASDLAKFLDRFKTDKALNILVLLLLYHRMYAEWEGSMRHEAVHVLVDAVKAYYTGPNAGRTPTEQHIIALFQDVYTILSCGMRIENSLNINCPLGIARHSAQVAAITPKEAGSLRLDPVETIVVGWVKREISDSRTYFEALGEISRAVIAWLRDAADWRQTVGDTARSVLAARDRIKPKSYYYATELDAHYTTLRRVLEFGDASQSAVDDFSIIYCFPFIIHGLRPPNAGELESQAERIFRQWQVWSDGQPESNAFAKAFRPSSFEEVELADVWATPREASGARGKRLRSAIPDDELPDVMERQKCYTLQSINFPDVIVHDVADPAKRIKLRCEMRLSLFGNHYLRFYTARGEENDFAGYREVSGHDIHRALRRASSLSGKEPISSEDGGYRNFTDDADGRYYPTGNLLEVARKLVDCLDSALPETMSVEQDLAKTSNVIFALTEFGGKATDALQADRREKALRQLFMNPIGGPADRLEPWLSRGENMRAAKNLAKTELGDDAQIYTTDNTTLIRLPSHAHFVRLDYEEMAEFAATLEPLYNYWNAQVSGRMEEVLDSLKNSERVSRIEANQIGLQKFVVRAQKAMLDIESPAIVTNSVYRSYLDAFMRQSTVGTLKRNFQGLSATAQDIVNTVTDYAQKRAEKWTQWRRYVWGTLIAVLGLLIGVGQLTEFKLHCIKQKPGCLWSEEPAETIPADNPSSGADRTPPAKTAQ